MAIRGTGTTIAFQSGLFGTILSASRTMERGVIQTSTFATTGSHTYIPTLLVEPGQYEVEIEMDPTDDIQAIMGAAAETITVTHTDGGGTTHATSGFAVSYNGTYPFEDRVIASFTLQLTGTTTVV